MCLCLYPTYSVQPINLINFSSCYVKTNVFRVINFYFRLSTASRYRIMGKKKYVPGRRTKLKIKVDNTKKVRLDGKARESWLGWRFKLSRIHLRISSLAVRAKSSADTDVLASVPHLLSPNHQPNQLSRALGSRRTFFVLSTFIFSLVRRPGTYFIWPLCVPGRRTKPKIKVSNTKNVRLDIPAWEID